MKKFMSIILAVALLLTMAACGSKPASDAGEADKPAKATKMTMGTGGTTGTYYAYGSVLGQYFKTKANVDTTVVSTDGSKANIQGIDAGDYQLATVQSDVMAYAWAGTQSFAEDGAVQSFRVIAGLYAEAVQLITMDPEIKSVADLKGKAVSIGAPGSGVYFNAMDVLTAAGLTLDDIQPQYLSFGDSTDGLKDGKIQAAFIVAGAPTPAITELCTTNSAYLVPIDGDVAKQLIEKEGSFYTAYKIPAGTYDKQTADVTTITVKATMIVSKDLSEDDVYKMTAAIFDNISSISHAKASELSLENATQGMAAPFHKGAAKYFAEKGITVTAE